MIFNFLFIWRKGGPWSTPGGAQSLLMALCYEIIPGSLGSSGVPGINPG